MCTDVTARRVVASLLVFVALLVDAELALRPTVESLGFSCWFAHPMVDGDEGCEIGEAEDDPIGSGCWL